MLRQIRHVSGRREQVDFSVMTQSFDRTKATSKILGSLSCRCLPAVLFRRGAQNHGVNRVRRARCQKSKFAHALTTMMIGSSGWLPRKTNSLSLWREAGHMDGIIQSCANPIVHDSIVITRNVESQALLSSLGIQPSLARTRLGSFEPHRPNTPQSSRESGWNEKTPILVLCPIHPFVWP